MICGNCGKDIPFVGNVCPYCHAAKGRSQLGMILSVVFGLLGAIVGAAVGNRLGSLGWGLLIGLVGGVVLAVIVSGSTRKEIPEVRVVNPPKDQP